MTNCTQVLCVSVLTLEQDFKDLALPQEHTVALCRSERRLTLGNIVYKKVFIRPEEHELVE